MLFGHNAWDAATTNVRSAEPDLTKVVDYPGQDYFTRFSVTDLGITPENTLLGKYDKGFHFTVAPERQVEVRISGPGAGPSTVKAILGPGDEIKRSGVDDKTIVKIGGVETVYPGENDTYYINFVNPQDLTPTGTDGDTDADDADVTTQTGDVTAVAPSESKFPTKLAAIGGIALIGVLAITKMGKRKA